MISITSEILSKTAFKIKPRHVYGHQDNRNIPLKFLEYLNVQMDELAKSIALENIRGKNLTTTFHSTKLGYGTTTYNNSIITSNLQTSLYNYIVHNNLCIYLSNKLSISLDCMLHKVNWKSYNYARK